jgi:signal peptidase I
MKRALGIFFLLIAVLTAAYFIARETGALTSYRHPTSGNEPAIKENATILVSNLVGNSTGDFVAYEHINLKNETEIRVKRLVGRENDTVEIKAGVAYVNGENIDENINLRHSYILTKGEFDKLRSQDKPDSKYTGVAMNGYFKMEFDDLFAAQFGLKENINIASEGYIDPTISEVFSENWNVDFFGPLVIPSGKCFLLGDNRHNSADSRYTGLVSESAIVGKVIVNNVRQHQL